MKEKPHIKHSIVLTPLRKPPRLEGAVENVGIKPKRKKSRKEKQRKMEKLKKEEKKI